MENAEKRIILISDTHFHHKKIIQYGRPENFEELLMSGLEEIQQDDLMIHLGDVCIGGDEEWNKFLYNDVYGKHILVRGNHDHKSLTFYAKYWDFTCDEFILRWHGFNLLFSHEPRPKRDGIDFNIHGHLHSKERFNRRFEDGVVIENEFSFDYDSQYHKLVSMEKSNYRPVLLRELIK